MSCSVYAIRHVASGVSYVARTTDFARSRLFHQQELRRGLHDCEELQAAWDFYRPGDFVVETIATGLSLREAKELVALVVETAPERVYNAPIRRRRGRAVVVQGVVYPSLHAASRATGVNVKTLFGRVRSTRRADYHYLQESA